MKLPFFNARNLFSLKRHNAVIAAVRPWQQPEAKFGNQLRFVLSAENVVLEVPRFSSGGGSGEQPQPKGIERFQICYEVDASTTPQFNAANYFWARWWNGVEEDAGDPIQIAKQWHQRNARIGRTYRGITTTFSYAYDATYKDWTKTVHVTSPGSTYDDETQWVDPPYLIGDEIWAADMGNADTGGTGVKLADNITAVTWLDMTPRSWVSVPVDPPP